MGTGPRGGKRVREAALAAAAENGPADDFNEPAAAAPTWDASPDPVARPAKKPTERKGDPAPSPKPGGTVDPSDVDKKSTLVLTKKGFGAAAVARAMTTVSVFDEDAKTSFNEQKRRRIANVTEWLLANAELWEVPREMLGEAKKARGIEGDEDLGQGEGYGEDKNVDDVDDFQNNLEHLTERARGLVKQGILPIAEEHVRIGKKASTGVNTATNANTANTGAGAGAQDRERTGKSLRAVKLEKAKRREVDLCPKLAKGLTCAFSGLNSEDTQEAKNKCEYSHDIDAFLRNKPGDLQGTCPFVTRGETVCRYGLRCRFSGTHKKRGKMNMEKSNPIELNYLSDQTQRLLQKCEYPLPKSDGVLRNLNVPVMCVSKTQASKLYGAVANNNLTKNKPQGSLGSSEPYAHLNRPGVLPSPPDFRGKLYVAPLTTVGNMPFRRACVRAGADVTVSEMAMATNLLKGDRKEWALVRRHESEKTFGVQVCGGHPDLMSRCGELLDQEVICDFVDINMGCPIDGVCAKGAGASLFKDEEGLQRCENTVRCTSRSMRKTPLTIKIRMGYEDDPANYVAHEVLAKCRNWGAAAATLHGRTRQQRYSRMADWRYIERCARVASKQGGGLPLIGNGDVFGYDDYERHMRSGNLATCMIGRGALVKPWVLTEIKEKRVWDISSTERLEIFSRFAKDGLYHWGSDEKGVEATRRFMCEWMSYTHRYVPVGLLERGVAQNLNLRPMPYDGRDALETLLASDDVADWISITEMFLGKPAPHFSFLPKHGSNSYSKESAAALRNLGLGVGEDEVGEEEQNG